MKLVHAVWVSLLLAEGCQVVRVATVYREPGTAAVAIRDHVSDFEKWGTKTFTVEFLRAGYARHWYFTENARGDKHREFVHALAHALEHYESVDVFLLAHSNHYVDWVREIDPALRHRIRLVYNTGCGDASQGAAWIDLGAKSYVAHGDDNLAPIFYYYFLPAWTSGASLEDAVAASNANAKSELFSGPAGWVLALLDKDAAFYWRGTEAQMFRKHDACDARTCRSRYANH
jgi:hypothetical protein